MKYEHEHIQHQLLLALNEAVQVTKQKHYSEKDFNVDTGVMEIVVKGTTYQVILTLCPNQEQWCKDGKPRMKSQPICFKN